jgi:hypothetical protein
MNDETDPWLPDIRKINLDVFVQANGKAIDPDFPFSVDGQFSRGIYCYGPKLRTHSCGEVSLALDMHRALVVEIDRLAVSTNMATQNGELPLMKDLALVSNVRHRHLPETLGAGVSEQTPFLVRPFRLGKTLTEVLQGQALDEAVAYGLLFVLTDLIAFLDEQSPFAGAFSFGGLQSSDIHLAYDGSIRILGLGYKSLKPAAHAPQRMDRLSLVSFATQLDIKGKHGLSLSMFEEESPQWVARRLRKQKPQWCARVRELLAGMFRTGFSQDIQKDRAFYGLQTLQ